MIYVVGGGPSLKGFDFDKLAGHATIGCNSAIVLPLDVIIFGDPQWWTKVGKQLSMGFKGRIIGCSQLLKPDPLYELVPRNTMNRVDGPGLGYAGNTGSLAIHWAAKEGHRDIRLLGFDMQMSTHANWHEHRYEPGDPTDYVRYRQLFPSFAQQLASCYPDLKVVNVTDGSRLDCWPKVSLEEHFG